MENPTIRDVSIRMRKIPRRTTQVAKYEVLQLKKVLDCNNAIQHTQKRMNEREYQATKAHIESKHKERIAAADADYKRELESLEVMRSLSQEINKKRGISEIGDSRPVITDLVKAVLPTLGEQFHSFDVDRAIEKKFPETKGTYRHNSLLSAISRLTTRKVIEVVEKGKGPEGHIYRVVS